MSTMALVCTEADMNYEVVGTSSRSFKDDEDFVQNASASADVLICLGGESRMDEARAAVVIELDLECLGEHTGEAMGEEGSNCVGFARYRNGNDEPSNLIELVKQPRTKVGAIEAAKAVFEAAGFDVAVCADQTGRIIDRLVRPKYNAALRFLDEGLANAEDMDLTCRLGLGYADGPLERVIRGDLARHHDISERLFRETGAPGYAPARRAVVAKNRQER